MGYALAFADAVNADKSGVFAGRRFDDAGKRQFKFAALLHDIGKIGVPENLLNKETRISRGRFSAVLARFEIARIGIVVSGGSSDADAWSSVEQLDNDKAFMERINRTGFINDEDYARLSLIRTRRYTDSYGHRLPVIEDDEWTALSLRKGNLTDDERELINSHAVSTWRILSKIPWTHELENIPEIAAHHHEKIDGTGYPDGLKADEISFESRILAVVDIYEALVAQDRPYKPAMPPEKALAILRSEAQSNRLDKDIVDFFITRNIYRIYFNPSD
jgi:hypothetical protein